MGDKATAEQLFEELGPVLDPAAIVYDAAEVQWAVLIDQTVRIDVGYDADAGQFVFALDLGRIPDHGFDQVTELLLRFSYVWRETGGLHGALDPEGHAVLMYKHAVAGLDVQRLHALLANLATHQRMWADLIDRCEDEDFDTDSIDHLVPAGGIRV